MLFICTLNLCTEYLLLSCDFRLNYYLVYCYIDSTAFFRRFFQETDLNDPNPSFPCGKCGLKVSNNHKAIQCDSCNFWTHKM